MTISEAEKARNDNVDLMGWRVRGGPFKYAPIVGTWNLNLQAERPAEPAPIHYHLPIKDFDVPCTRPTIFALAHVIFNGVILRKSIYVGCAGGMGRTGIILALLVRLAYGLSGDAAIRHVRRKYNVLAIETAEQELFIMTFPVRTLRKWLWVCRKVHKLFS